MEIIVGGLFVHRTLGHIFGLVGVLISRALGVSFVDEGTTLRNR